MMSRRQRLGLSAVCLVMLPATLFMAWQTVSRTKSYYISRSHHHIDAKIETISIPRKTYFGEISFVIPSAGGEARCRAYSELGQESLQLKVGQIIKVVPRENCDAPIVVSASTLPVLQLMMALIYGTILWVFVKSAIKGQL